LERLKTQAKLREKRPWFNSDVHGLDKLRQEKNNRNKTKTVTEQTAF